LDARAVHTSFCPLDKKEVRVELKLLEEAYTSSKYVATEFSEEEVVRVKRAVEEVMEHA